jgi:hypothetical protein
MVSTVATVRAGVAYVPDVPGIGLGLIDAAIVASRVNVESLRAQSTLSAKHAHHA